ncbi:hypothetical protein D9M71_778290 [compost metagenome]
MIAQDQLIDHVVFGDQDVQVQLLEVVRIERLPGACHPQPLGQADGLVNGRQVVEVDLPGAGHDLRFVAAIAAGQHQRAEPMRLQALLESVGVQFDQDTLRGKVGAGRATDLRTGAPATQPATDDLGQFADR